MIRRMRAYLTKTHKFLFFVLLFFMPTQLGYHVWPSWSYVFGRRIDYLSPTVFFTDAILVVMLLAWTVANYKELRKAAVYFFRSKRNTAIFMSSIVFIVMNILYAERVPVSFYKWLKFLEFSLFIVYMKSTKPSPQYSTLTLLGSIIYTSFLAIFQFVFQKSAGGPAWLLGERTFSAATPGIARFDLCTPLSSVCLPLLRSYGTFPHPNVLAGFITVLLPVFFWISFTYKHKKLLSTVLNIVLLFCAITLLLTFGRSAFIVAVLTLGCLFFITKKSQRRAALLIAAVSVLLASFFALQKSFRLSESVLIRSNLNKAAISEFLQSPLVGTGLGNFIVKIPSLNFHAFVYVLQPVHNIYLLILAETGLVGFTLFCGFFVYIGRFYVCRKDKQIDEWHTVSMLSLISILALGFFDHYLLTIQQGQLLFAYCVGMMLALKKTKRIS